MTHHLLEVCGTVSRAWRTRTLAALVFLGLPDPALAATLFVSPTNGSNANSGLSPGAALKTLTFAIDKAVANDTINLAAGTYNGASGETFELSINKDLTIIGAGPTQTIVAGSRASRVFSISAGRTVVLRSMGITDGKAADGGAIRNQGNLTLTNVDVFENKAEQSATGMTATASGGGISSRGNLTIIGSKVRNNQANATSVNGNAFVFGGGIYLEEGKVRIVDSVVSGNVATVSADGSSNANGGGVRIDGPPDVTISSSTVSDNVVSVFGDKGNLFVNGVGIDNRGILKVDNSTVAKNSMTLFSSTNGALVLNGVGIHNGTGATLTFVNGTVSENTGSFTGFDGNLFLEGAGINSDGTLTLRNVTVSGNRLDVVGTSGNDIVTITGVGIENRGSASATNITVTANEGTATGGGGGNDALSVIGAGISSISGQGVLTLENSIVANNTPGDVAGTVASIGHNIIADNSLAFPAPSDLTITNPLLGPLQANGGLTTKTHALLVGSPAIDSGDNASCPPTDQGGFRRPVDGSGDGIATCDRGAVERVSIATTLLAAVLPTERTAMVGGPAVTAFGTILNTGSVLAKECTLTAFTPVTADFSYLALPAGAFNTPVDIPAGQGQSFVFGFTPTSAFPRTDVKISFACANTAPAPSVPVSIFGLRVTTTPAPDPVAIVAVGPPNDGILRLASVGALAVATINLGASGAVTVTADTGGTTLPLTLNLCETNPVTGFCLDPPTPSVQTQMNAGATQSFGVFADSGGAAIAFDPNNNRINVRFEGAGGGGGTSVAVCTQPLCPP